MGFMDHRTQLSPLPEVLTPPIPAYTQPERSHTSTSSPLRSSSSATATAAHEPGTSYSRERERDHVQVSPGRSSESPPRSPPKPLPGLPPSLSRAQNPGPIQIPRPARNNSHPNATMPTGPSPAPSRPILSPNSASHPHPSGQYHNGAATLSPLEGTGTLRPTWGNRDSLVEGGYRTPPPPNPVWRMPSFRRTPDPNQPQVARGVDISGGPTPDERVSRYGFGRLRAFSGYMGRDSQIGNGHAHPVVFNAPQRPLTVAERLFPTLQMARAERENCAQKARWTNIIVNIAMGAQILLGALTTGLSAAVTGKQISIITAIFGGLTTIVASYLARVRGSGEPENSRIRTKELDHFIREVESTVLDRGWRINSKMTSTPSDPGNLDTKDELDILIDEFRSRFEEIMGNLEERHLKTTA